MLGEQGERNCWRKPPVVLILNGNTSRSDRQEASKSRNRFIAYNEHKSSVEQEIDDLP